MCTTRNLKPKQEFPSSRAAKQLRGAVDPQQRITASTESMTAHCNEEMKKNDYDIEISGYAGYDDAENVCPTCS